MLTAKGYGSFHPLMLAGQQETVEGNALAGNRRRYDRRVKLALVRPSSGCQKDTAASDPPDIRRMRVRSGV